MRKSDRVVSRVVLLLAVLLGGSLVSLAWSGLKEGIAALGHRDYTTAYREFLPLAEQGDAMAQAVLGDLYALGHGVRQDYHTAVTWFRKAAEQGNAIAQYSLGVAYANGWGVPQDSAAAVIWYRKAAQQGDADAQAILGDLYREGQGVPQDYKTAVIWYRQAAEQGNAFAQYSLGFMYALGWGVPQDYVQAQLWVNLGTAALPPGESRDKAARFRTLLARMLTPAQLAEAQRRAREWRPKSP